MKGTLLIVDDEPILLKTMQFSLKSIADKIITAVDGREALDIILQENIHCVLSDYNMPRMTGMDLLKELRARMIMIPFIIFTGNASDKQMREGAMFGAFDFIEKPRFEGLKETVQLALQAGLFPDAPVDFKKLTHKSEFQILKEREKL